MMVRGCIKMEWVLRMKTRKVEKNPMVEDLRSQTSELRFSRNKGIF
jgi:hypothetical protein